MAQPEQPDTSSHHLTVGVKQLYKSLLNQHAQKIWKQLPVYQTLNEGSDHSPKFRCTVWVDGVSYTSPNTFTQRKMAEVDASRIAFFGSLQKLKNEASRLVLEDRSLCKAALVEYATRMNIQKPTYQTMQLGTNIPVFRSSLVVDGVSCTGENGRNKKEAEQSAARAAVLKCLDSESGHIMSEIINCRFKRSTELKKLQSTQNDSNKVVPTGGENALTLNETTVEEVTKMPSPTGVENVFTLNETKVEEGTQMPSPTGVENSLTLNETKVEEGTKLPSPTGVENVFTLNETKVEEGTQMPSPTGVKNSLTLNETKVEEGTKLPSPTGVENVFTLNETKVEEGTQMPSPTGVENILTLNETKVEEGTKLPSPTSGEKALTLNETKVEEGTKMPSPTRVENGLALNEIKVEEGTKMPSPTGVEGGITLNETKLEEETKVPSSDICSVQNATIPAMHSYVNLPQSHTQNVSTQALTTAITVHTVLPKSPFAGTHFVPTSCVKSAPSMVVNHPPPNVVQVVKSEESSLTVAIPLTLSSPATVQTSFESPTSGKKRNHNNRKMAQKKMRIENQSPIPAIPLSQAPSSSAR